MRSTKKLVGIGVAATAVLGLGLSSGQAQADAGPASGDVVGVGSDTVQNIGNFLADGDPDGLSTGANASGGRNRLISFDATPDANDRAGYIPTAGTSSAIAPLNPTIILRAGTSPVLRPNGSGSGIAAFLKDTGTPAKINFVRASRLPNATEIATANGQGTFNGLHVVKISTDALKVAAANTTNAPAALTPAQLVSIYKCDTRTWNQVGGSSSANIIPQIPQAGSGTGDTFRNDLKAANGGTAVTIGSCVQTVQENDPSAITSADSPADAIAPFSEGRLNLYQSGYFKDPTVAFGNTPVTLSAGIKLLNGAGSYSNTRGLYIVFREKDLSSTTRFQPGGSLNFARALFANPGSAVKPYVASNDGQAAIEAGGGTAVYVDCGVNPTSC
ncbi:substrate-binding domain-containing protein [Angustibacter aerolatus]